jgi:tRNA G18 (ribose-2'-O)-methylase SpoU
VLHGHTNVRIPIHADVDSLNVGHAVAAALAVVASSDG